ncbi:MAG: YHYH domain-containing protein [Burkholderiales bacterium]
MVKKTILLFIGALLSVSVLAHSGGKDRNGCHTDHRTGGYHCH